MTTAIVVQARMGSTRCPGKVLADVHGEPLLSRMLARLALVRTPVKIVVATTTAAEDAPIARLAEREGAFGYRGQPEDLLDRHVEAARAVAADIVAKIPSDCPLVDPKVVDEVLEAFLASDGADYVGNLHPASWPDGNDVEVMPVAALELARAEATRPHEREHTTPYLWDHPERFRLGSVVRRDGRDLSMTHRFTVDYPEDLALVRAVFGALLPTKGPEFTADDVVELLDARPDIYALNAHYAGVNWYRNHLSDLKTVTAKETRWPSRP